MQSFKHKQENNKIMKIFNLLLSILITIIFYACQIENKKVIKDDNISIQMNTYQNNEYGFFIEYPKEWKILKGNEDVIFAVKMITDSLDNSFQNAIHITSLLSLKHTQFNLNDVVEASIKDMTNTFKKFKIIQKKETNINGLKAIKLKCSFISNKENITTLLYFVKTSDNIYLIGLSSTSDKFINYKKVYEYIAASFNVL